MSRRSIKYPYHALVLSFRKCRSRLRPSWDPLQHLPHELVGTIFDHWLWLEIQDQHPNLSQLPVLLSLVSKSWRDFVYVNPLLWRFLDINASKNKICRLAALENRMSRTKDVSLVLNVVVEDTPHLEALRVLFSQSHRLYELQLCITGVFRPTWWRDVPMGPFSQLRMLAVNAWPMHSKCQVLTSLRPSFILDILTACPELCFATFDFIAEVDTPSPKRSAVINLLENICAPLLSTFSITWSEDDDRSLIGPPLETFLSSSPLLRDLTLDNVIHSEASLIKILRTHSLINKLVFKTICDLPNLITDRTFRLLTFNERARILLPQLEVLLMSGGLHGVGSDVIAEFLKSRGAEWCARDLSQPQNHTGRPGTLKLVELDDCDNSLQHNRGRLWRFEPTSGISLHIAASAAQHLDLTTLF
ncbi:hypothetical protein SCLCIDRAFT_27035 [Scleroderma citrinum Foug A]|uniref:Uncharacterized protein n=1 Tax=Scleroderma citrinum Foug A TaxID=1036808 RepID=A0A0C3DGF5_9AGAM|nr:hypothetical protein SCLCIDRAFT_27035 [Scleroderma citrinum Foug A]